MTLIELYMRLGPDVFGAAPVTAFCCNRSSIHARCACAAERCSATRRWARGDLKTGLAIHAKRIDTGSAWVVTNNPLGVYYDPPAESGTFPNKRYRLIDLVLASAAAPTFFDEVVIDVEFDERRHRSSEAISSMAR